MPPSFMVSELPSEAELLSDAAGVLLLPQAGQRKQHCEREEHTYKSLFHFAFSLKHGIYIQKKRLPPLGEAASLYQK